MRDANWGMPVVSGLSEDLQMAEIGIYREVDGRRITNVRAKAPSGSENNVAFAPDGRQLAVLTRDLIELYSLPQN